ncbi:hypothetical protein D9613_005645 [Agrocybe pediades]|uniref:Uncharacterized protein n=1 Tax=Agrocybe pediades TaxID=84607 RepID=A0A8H4VPA7_9AGAR|nr:hypothetical protein D9613_005645 [Agrocybe pediades]
MLIIRCDKECLIIQTFNFAIDLFKGRSGINNPSERVLLSPRWCTPSRFALASILGMSRSVECTIPSLYPAHFAAVLVVLYAGYVLVWISTRERKARAFLGHPSTPQAARATVQGPRVMDAGSYSPDIR